MSDAKLKELYAKRSSVKGRLTKFKNYLASFEKVNAIDEFEISKLNIQLPKIESLASTFEELQIQIEVMNSTDIDSELDERDVIEQEFAHLIALAHQYQTRFNGSKTPPLCDAQSTSSCCHDRPGIGFKPPTLQIGKFDGSYYKWLEFRDLYCSLVHENKHIPTPIKFCYLNSYLEGEAARVISNLEVTESNYNKAWDLLRERYDNKRLLIKNHLNALLNIDVKSNESASTLRSIIDNTNKNLRALSSLGEPTSYWDTIIVHIISSKLGSKTSMKWEEYRNTLSESPSLEQFNSFLKQRADILETYNHSRSSEDRSSTSYNKISSTYNKKRVGSLANNNSSFTTQINSTGDNKTLKNCVVCDKQHRIYDCAKFRNMSIEQRQSFVVKSKLCQNCLRLGHKAFTCRFGVCRNCKRRHNTLLCDNTQIQVVSPADNANVINPDAIAQTLCTTNTAQNTFTLLSTAMVLAINPSNNKRQIVRVLLDCGSQCSLASKRLRDKLGLRSRPGNSINVVGIGNSTSHWVNEFCVFKLKSLHGDYTVQLTCPVLSDLTGDIPKFTMDPKLINIPAEVQLADPNFYRPSPIDVLVGADLFGSIVGSERKSLGSRQPNLINSEFGWILSGPIYLNSRISNFSCNFSKTQSDNFSNQLSRFWELEELPLRSILSEDEKACEQHFKTHTSRDSSGRFCVRLPLKDSPNCLGNSYFLAKKRFFNLEKRFRASPELKSQYIEFINEYIKLGHCSILKDSKPNPCYFLCHHAVLKQKSESTKLRVVFDGSARTSSGLSINDLQHIGPIVQDSLFSILIRFRQYLYVLTGDVEKFFRQINVHDDDRNLQLILWRDDESKPIQTLRLNTVTYGFASASYLSTKCIWQLGQECPDELIRTVIQHDLYLDDLLTGANSVSELRHILNSVISVLRAGCFPLRKFKSNVPSIFENTLINPLETLTLSESTNTLGLQWKPPSDTLHVSLYTPNNINEHATKRSILSNTFKTFDPLGLISPCTIRLKLLMQELWRRNIDWDVPVPSDIRRYWLELVHEFQNIPSVTVPRLVLCDSPVIIELHSFCDASMSAHGACVYLRSVDSAGSVVVKLLCAKSKVNPNKPVTIPRLELMGALLAARLCKSVLESLRCQVTRCTHWSDSSVVLGWLHTSPTKLKTFVANRIVEISDTTSATNWRHVPTDYNPADLISRGVQVHILQQSEFWWSGPEFLLKPESEWPMLNTKCQLDLPEIKCNIIQSFEPIINFSRFSNFMRLKRSFAYVLRFIHNTRFPKTKISGALTVNELTKSFNVLCKFSQLQSFSIEYDVLSKHKSISTKSNLLSLSPFLDKYSVMRVGGRLACSDYDYDKGHPIILHSKHPFTCLIFRYEHIKQMHAGPQLLLYSVREYVWPIGGRNLARSTVRNCIRCRRFQGRTYSPRMGHLPSQRTTPSFPFETTGVDFAGPFMILNKKGRGSKTLKCYLCLFVCFRFKCVHLEAVTELSKDAFIMTLRRFIARRGKPLEIFSDNGRNFVAAAKDIGNFLKHNSTTLSEFAANEGINFKFIPSYAPHFGGLWEAGIKSAKHHIKRVMANLHLTYEELSTLFAQVEAILNSRPLCPISSSPDDLQSLSPGHFLIGRPLTSLPDPTHDDSSSSFKRYARIEEARKHFWSRWQREYVNELQQRVKWRVTKGNLSVGDLVLLHEDNSPPLHWRLGRVRELHPGVDGVPRVADIATQRGVVRRTLTRLCPLLSVDPGTEIPSGISGGELC